jgi:hypothetical protein
MSGITVKLATWSRQNIPAREDELEAIRKVCVKGVYEISYRTKKPVSLQEIYNYVRREIESDKTWRWQPRGKRTIDRRVNEAASTKCYAVPPIVAVTAGFYQPNLASQNIKAGLERFLL